MTRSLRAELRKLRLTRSLWAVPVVGAAVSVVAGVVLVGWIDAAEQAARLSEHGPLRFGASNLGLLLLVFGIRVFGDEVHHGTLATGYVIDPHRRRSLLAKLVVAGATAVAVCAAVYAAVVPATRIAVSARDLPMVMDGAETLTLFGRATVAMVVLTVLGVALAAIVRNRTVALVASIVWLLLGETIVGGVLRHPEWMPSELVQSLVTGGGADGRLGAGPAAVALLALAASAVGGAVASLDRDVP